MCLSFASCLFVQSALTVWEVVWLESAFAAHGGRSMSPRIIFSMSMVYNVVALIVHTVSISCLPVLEVGSLLCCSCLNFFHVFLVKDISLSKAV